MSLKEFQGGILSSEEIPMIRDEWMDILAELLQDVVSFLIILQNLKGGVLTVEASDTRKS